MSRRDKEIEELKYVYDHAWTNFKDGSEYYFKRTQIIMIAIQLALIIGITNFLTSTLDGIYKSLFTIVFSFLGIRMAFAWLRAAVSQYNSIELCRRNLRNIERRFMELGFPLYIWTLDKEAFYNKNIWKFQTCENTEVEKNLECSTKTLLYLDQIFEIRRSRNDTENISCFMNCYLEKEPESNGKNNMGIMKIERVRIIRTVIVVWFLALLGSVIYLCFHWSKFQDFMKSFFGSQ